MERGKDFNWNIIGPAGKPVAVCDHVGWATYITEALNHLWFGNEQQQGD